MLVDESQRLFMNDFFQFLDQSGRLDPGTHVGGVEDAGNFDEVLEALSNASDGLICSTFEIVESMLRVCEACANEKTKERFRERRRRKTEDCSGEFCIYLERITLSLDQRITRNKGGYSELFFTDLFGRHTRVDMAPIRVLREV